MSHLIICLGKENQEKLYNIISHFDNVYIISEHDYTIDVNLIKPEQKVSLLLVPSLDLKNLSIALFNELKSQLAKDKITDLDIAINIYFGSGKIHMATISAVIKLGYGIRFVDVDEKGNILEL
ncbi:MAG: hypothetical protein KatS3mg002_1168 [Candidatus Woesearchaeota archaeon]|nr:MAG: hypothetical protein KatS3mg002_1168 [Candidatus Woesearchaeota archaeon]